MKLMKKIGTFYLSTTALHLCGIVFLAAGMFGTMIQANVFGTGMTSEELLLALDADSGLMGWVTLAAISQGLEACAVPLFAFLLVEGAVHTSDFNHYFLRVLAVAAVSQLPYNLLMAGSPLVFSGLNPAFSAVMSMVTLFFFTRFPERRAGHWAIKGCAILFAFLWSNMLGVAHGAACVIVTAVLWGFRGKQNLQTIFGVIAMLCCTIFSVAYMVAPLSFLLLHFYGGKKGKDNRAVSYVAYPALLLVFGVASVLC